VTINFVQPVPFINGYRIVVSDLELDGDNAGTLVIEAYNVILDDWLAVRMFACSSRMEALGIAMTFAAQALNRIDMDALVTRMTSSRPTAGPSARRP
jgi:hypothetical protein